MQVGQCVRDSAEYSIEGTTRHKRPKQSGAQFTRGFMSRGDVSEAYWSVSKMKEEPESWETVKDLPGAAEHQRAIMILIREVQR